MHHSGAGQPLRRQQVGANGEGACNGEHGRRCLVAVGTGYVCRRAGHWCAASVSRENKKPTVSRAATLLLSLSSRPGCGKVHERSRPYRRRRRRGQRACRCCGCCALREPSDLGKAACAARTEGRPIWVTGCTRGGGCACGQERRLLPPSRPARGPRARRAGPWRP